MKKSIISRGLYVENLRRLRVFGFIALSLVLIFTVAPILFQVVEYFFISTSYVSEEIAKKSMSPSVVNFSDVFMTIPATVSIVPPIMVLIAFSVFNKRASSDFYHSLPYTRTCLFLSAISAVLTWTVGICLISSAVSFAGYMAFPKVFSVTFDGAIEILLTYFAVMLMTTGATALGMGLTGTILTNISVTALIVFMPRFIITIVTSWIEYQAEFLSFSASGESFLSPGINVIIGAAASYFFYIDSFGITNNLAADIYSICLGLVYLGLALFVFIKRKSETATQPAPGRLVQHIIRIMLSSVVGIIATFAFIEGEFALGIILFLVTATVYLAYELITTHRFKNCLKALPFFGVVIAFCIGCGIFTIAVPPIAAAYTPSADSIDSVRFINEDRDGWFGKEAAELEITDKEIITMVADTLDSNMKYYRNHGRINNVVYADTFTDDSIYHGSYNKQEYIYAIDQTFAIKDGLFTRYRTLFFTPEDYAKILQTLEKNEDYRKACMTVPDPAPNSIDFGLYERNVNYSYYEEVFECMKEEIRALTFEEWYNLINLDGYYTEYHLNYFSDDYDSMYIHIPISSEVFPKTFEMLLETEKVGYEDRLDTLNGLLNDDEFKETEEVYAYSVTATVKAKSDEGDPLYYTVSYDIGYGQIISNYLPALQDMVKKAKNTNKAPSAEEYINVNYSYESSYGGVYEDIYLPLPDDFDPEEWEFSDIVDSYIKW